MKYLKKDTGGYALLYVLVIVMVLAAISMMICTVALRNLQSQETAVERMADKYAAQGEIERIKAIAGDLTALELNASYYADIRESYLNALKSKSSCNIEWKDACLQIVSEKDSIQVTAVLNVNLTAEPVKEVNSETGIETELGYKLVSASVDFESYTIEFTGGAA